ncbi:Polysaccharide biosynthesis protein [human gut metagenome]|uniref:Polysaccharide biosynthesis protein n=1 Tax=human gut metagenome TaxID=408170 RepID=W1WQH4_9ZZZZ
MLKDSMILTFSKGIRAIITLLFNMIIARAFSENLLGTYKHIMLIVNMLTAICILGIPTTISYFYSSYSKEKKNKFLGNTITILTIISVVTSLLIILFREKLALMINNPEILNYINIISIYVFVMIISSFLENLFISSNSAGGLGKIYITYTIGNLIFMLTSVFVFKSLYFLILSIVIIEIVRTVIMYVYIKNKEKFILKIDYPMMTSQIKFALPLGVVALVQNLNMYIDKLFISNKYEPDQFAAFANAATDIPLVGIVTVSVAAVILPHMSKIYRESKDFHAVLDIWKDSCNKTAIIMFPIFWIAFLFSVGYIELIFSEKYIIQSTPIFLIYLMKFPLYCTVFGNILIVLGKEKYVMYNSIVGIVLNIILNSVLINIIGMKGSALSTVLVQYVVVYLQLKQIAKNTNVSILKLMPYKKLFLIFIIPGFLAIPLSIISNFLGMSECMSLIVMGGTTYILSFITYYYINIIDRKYVEEIIKIVNRREYLGGRK